VGPGADRVERLAAGNLTGPYRPSRLLGADLRGRQPLVRTVVPLVQVLVHSRLLVEARQPAGLERPRRGARQHECEPPPGELVADRPCLPPPALRQGNVRAAGVASGAAPFGLAVPDEDDLPGTGAARQRSSSVSGPSECAVGWSS